MNLIEEIEAASNEIVHSAWWQRIKAALEAAQRMDSALECRDDGMQGAGQVLHDAQCKFREAMEAK
jgi:hypothetical protein